MIHSYPSIFNLGHKAVADIFLDPVLVQEKVDGSQFSFGVFPDDLYASPYEGGSNLKLRCRSKGAQLNVIAPDKMFQAAVNVVLSMADRLKPGWTYRAEYLAKPKHNSLAYDRIPRNHLILFDVNRGLEDYLAYEDVQQEAERLDLEVVPLLYHGIVSDVAMMRELLDRQSVLGGQKIEGVVVKNYARFTEDKKAMLAKFVSEAFKEVHAAEWKKSNPTRGDLIEQIVADYASPARYAKAVQHLAEAGQLEGSPRDIGLLIREVPADILKECEDDLKARLFNHFWPYIARGVIRGIPEYYKQRLLEEQFR